MNNYLKNDEYAEFLVKIQILQEARLMIISNQVLPESEQSPSRVYELHALESGRD